MSVSPISMRSLQNLLPRPRRPRVGRSLRYHGWNPRRAEVGIEVCGTSLKLVAVRPGWSRRWLTVTGEIRDHALLDASALRERMREVLGAIADDDPLIVLGLPRREVLLRHLRLPAAAEKSLESVLNLQLGLYKPSDDEEFCWDAAVVRSGDHLDVSLMFLPRPRLEEWAGRLREAGFSAARVTTAQFATLDWVLRGVENAGKTRLLLVQDHGREVDLALVDGGVGVATRSLVVPEQDAPAALAGEVRNALSAHRANTGAPGTVVVSGPRASSWRGALQEFGEVRELAQYCDAWSLTETAAAGGTPDEFWGAIALALDGLNWRGDYRLNLLPQELRPSRRRWRNAPLFALLALNLLLLLGMVARGPLQRYLMIRRYNSEIARIDRSSSLVEQQIRKEQKVEDRLATLRDFQQRGRRPLDALGEIAQKLPPDAWVGVYTCKQGQVDISGTAKSASAVLPVLKASAQFQDVQFAGGLTRDSDGGERFHIQMKLKEMP